jgi:phosphonate transport system permease protein
MSTDNILKSSTGPHSSGIAADYSPSSFCLTCVAVWAVLAAAIGASFWYLKLDLAGLVSAESRGYMGQYVAKFFPPDLSAPFLWKVAVGAAETVAISLISTLLAAVGGMLLALPAAGRFGGAAMQLTRFCLNVLRSVPELVWATLTVLAAGLGPFAGTLALALHTAGVLGRLFAEALQNARPEPERALLEAGASRSAAFFYATLPMVLPQVMAYSLYRWEMNIRMAAVLGFVGAGGLGGLLYFHLSILQEAPAATVIVAMLALVILVDTVSAFLRRGLKASHQ